MLGGVNLSFLLTSVSNVHVAKNTRNSLAEAQTFD